MIAGIIRWLCQPSHKFILHCHSVLFLVSYPHFIIYFFCRLAICLFVFPLDLSVESLQLECVRNNTLLLDCEKTLQWYQFMQSKYWDSRSSQSQSRLESFKVHLFKKTTKQPVCPAQFHIWNKICIFNFIHWTMQHGWLFFLIGHSGVKKKFIEAHVPDNCMNTDLRKESWECLPNCSQTTTLKPQCPPKVNPCLTIHHQLNVFTSVNPRNGCLSVS